MSMSNNQITASRKTPPREGQIRVDTKCLSATTFAVYIVNGDYDVIIPTYIMIDRHAEGFAISI